MKRIIMFIVLALMLVSCCPCSKAVCPSTALPLPTENAMFGPEVKCWIVSAEEIAKAGLTCPATGFMQSGDVAMCSYKVNHELEPYHPPKVLFGAFTSLESEGDINLCGCGTSEKWYNATHSDKYNRSCGLGKWLDKPKGESEFFVMFRHVYAESTIEAHANFVASKFRFIW